MTFIHVNRLPIRARSRKILGNLEIGASTMTLQGFSIKSNDWLRERPVARLGLFRNLAFPAAAIYDRARRPAPLRLWTLPERALRDLGFDAGEAEISRLTDAGSKPLGHFGLASLPFQDSRDGLPPRSKG